MLLERTPFERVPFWRSSLIRGEWRDLVFVNYAVDPRRLLPHLPRGVDLDLFQGRAIVSLVALRFVTPRLLGVSIDQVITQVNFRFYVREGERRGVVFLTEYAPRPWVLLGARSLYHEPFRRGHVTFSSSKRNHLVALEYTLRVGRNEAPNYLSVRTDLDATTIMPGSERHFIAHRPYGYSHSLWGDTTRYAVSHEEWNTRSVHGSAISWDFAALHGAEWTDLSSATPHSMFVAAGSNVYVSLPEKL